MLKKGIILLILFELLLEVYYKFSILLHQYFQLNTQQEFELQPNSNASFTFSFTESQLTYVLAGFFINICVCFGCVLMEANNNFITQVLNLGFYCFWFSCEAVYIILLLRSLIFSKVEEVSALQNRVVLRLILERFCEGYCLLSICTMYLQFAYLSACFW